MVKVQGSVLWLGVTVEGFESRGSALGRGFRFRVRVEGFGSGIGFRVRVQGSCSRLACEGYDIWFRLRVSD